MDGFRQWAMAVCTAAVVCTLLQILFPDNRLGQQGKMVLPCVFLCVLLSPLSGFEIDVKLPDLTLENSLNSEGLSDRIYQQTVAQTNRLLQKKLNQSFEKYGWNVRKVVTDMDIEEDGSIHMGQIAVYVDEKDVAAATQIEQAAASCLGMPVAVAMWEETR